MQEQSLAALIEDQLAAARAAGNGRSARTVYGGSGHSLRQTLLALTAGSRLDEHNSPGEATLFVLHGRVELTRADDSLTAAAGDHLTIPPVRHGLHALKDSVVLLTVNLSPSA